jgi:hypothetical protein
VSRFSEPIPIADGKRYTQLCSACSGLPGLPLRSDRDFVTDACPACGSPDGLWLTPLFLERGGLIKCQSCGESTRLPAPPISN